MEQTEEILKAIELANQGGGDVWLPIATITASFSVVILLLLAFWKQSQKVNDKRHEDNERIIKGVSKTQQTMSLLLVKIESNQEHQQKDIDKLTA